MSNYELDEIKDRLDDIKEELESIKDKLNWAIYIIFGIVLGFIIIEIWHIFIPLVLGIIAIIITGTIIYFLYDKLTYPSRKRDYDEKWKRWEEQREKEKMQKRKEPRDTALN